MSDEVDERRAHLRAIAITSATALAGVAAAIGSEMVTSGMSLENAAGSSNAQLVVVAAIVVQLPIYHFVYEEWGGAKDVLYVAFMTFIMWFVTWGVILTSGANLV